MFGAGRPETNPEDSLNESSSEDLESDGFIASAVAVDGVNIDKWRLIDIDRYVSGDGEMILREGNPS